MWTLQAGAREDSGRNAVQQVAMGLNSCLPCSG